MESLNSAMLLIMLLNPFLVILYLIDIVKKHDLRLFSYNLIRAGLYTAIILSVFAVVGEVAFRELFKANFASFEIFGGIVFLLIGIQFVLKGSDAIDVLRGDSKSVSGAIAMPILIGPGTISASVLMGKRMPVYQAVLVITVTVAFSIAVMILLKCLHDYMKGKRSNIVERYIEVAGRILALYIGTISIDMIVDGIRRWAAIF